MYTSVDSSWLQNPSDLPVLVDGDNRIKIKVFLERIVAHEWSCQ